MDEKINETELTEYLKQLVILPKADTAIFPDQTTIIKLIPQPETGLDFFKILDENRFLGVMMFGPGDKEIRQIGTLVRIEKVIPDFFGFRQGNEATFILDVMGICRIGIKNIVQEKPYLRAEVEILEDIKEDGEKLNLLTNSLKDGFEALIDLMLKANMLNNPGAEELKREIKEIEEPGKLADKIMAIGFELFGPLKAVSVPEAQEILECLNVKERIEKVLKILAEQTLEIKTRESFSDILKKNVLREKMAQIQKELGEEAGETQEHKEKIENAQMPPETKTRALKELEKFLRMSPQNPGREKIEDWLIIMEELPWNKSTKDSLNLKAAQAILDEDHYELRMVKEKILEFLATKKRNPGNKGSILCFIGPPGTGKTSVGRSIARAMGRKFIGLSLGGVEDQSEIRGHRRTYVDALPGQIIQKIKEVGFNNPVFMIDEINKISKDRLRGDPASALLEVLDPEQNNTFRDHFLDVPFDLSKVFFITTGNLADPIHPALKDRMEIVEFPGYTKEEKLMIAKIYQIPRQLKAAGLTTDELRFSDKGIAHIIRYYTREAGVRNLEREIANICRKKAKKITEAEEAGKTGISKKEIITPKKVSKYLGPIRLPSLLEGRITGPGIATGLAWTEAGGEVTFIEAARVDAKNVSAINFPSPQKCFGSKTKVIKE
ncbi:MAG: endopeptidase La [Parcubacteria group bacterium CG11_big_fil_rev_8_21_14_0_20_39_14]|nr:MAG: endopeptidase La [Parcubacteria group bacterium CG11_big_fil_rev_8_21_14_0_20_39_14]